MRGSQSEAPLSPSRPPPSSARIPSHDGVAGEVGDAAEVAAVASHQDVALVAPPLAPAVGERQKRRRWKGREVRGVEHRTAFHVISLSPTRPTEAVTFNAAPENNTLPYHFGE